MTKPVDKTAIPLVVHNSPRLITARSQDLPHPGSAPWTCHLPSYAQIAQRLLLLLNYFSDLYRRKRVCGIRPAPPPARRGSSGQRWNYTLWRTAPNAVSWKPVFC